jgi:hypothetical protein
MAWRGSGFGGKETRVAATRGLSVMHSELPGSLWTVEPPTPPHLPAVWGDFPRKLSGQKVSVNSRLFWQIWRLGIDTVKNFSATSVIDAIVCFPPMHQSDPPHRTA